MTSDRFMGASITQFVLSGECLVLCDASINQSGHDGRSGALASICWESCCPAVGKGGMWGMFLPARVPKLL